MLKFFDRNKYSGIIFISWLFLWLSLGILPTNLNNKLYTYKDLINFLRVYTPLFFSVSLLLIISIKYLRFFNHYKKNSLTIEIRPKNKHLLLNSAHAHNLTLYSYSMGLHCFITCSKNLPIVLNKY